MQTSLKIMNRAIWNFQLLPLSIFHTLYMGWGSPLTVLKYPKVPMSFLNLLEILEIKTQEAWHTKFINNIYMYIILYQFCLSLLSNQKNVQCRSFSTNKLREITQEKKLPGSDSKAFALNSAHEWEFFPFVSLKQNRTTTETPKTNSVSPYWLSQPETVRRALYSSMDEGRHQGIQAHIPPQITKSGHANQTQPRRSCKS